MEIKSNVAAASGGLAILTALIAPALNVPKVETDANPTIIVIGGGVSGKGENAGPYDLSLKDRPSGPAMSAGASAYIQAHKSEFDGVQFEWIDDHNSAAEARSIAQRIASTREDVIAVVGHTQSDTTHAAMSIYARAGIPMILPVATSVDLGADPLTGNARTSDGWCVRREILHDGYQAFAIEQILRKEKRERCLVVAERSSTSHGYVAALHHMVERTIGPKIIATVRVDSNSWNGNAFAEDVIAQKIDVVCFLGYPEMARRVLYQLRPELLRARSKSAPLIPVIVPDACIRLRQEWTTGDPRMIVTFPIDVQKQVFNSNELEFLRDALGSKETTDTLKQQEFGFEITGRNSAEAALVAIRNARAKNRKLSRKLMREQLGQPKPSHSYFAFISGGDSSAPAKIELKIGKESADTDVVNDLRKSAVTRAVATEQEIRR